MRDDALRFARLLSLPVIVLVGGFGLWTQLAHGKAWTWMVLGVAVVALLTAVALVWQATRDGLGVRVHRWSSVAAVVVLLFGCAVSEPVAVDAQPGVEPDDLQRVVDAPTR